MQTEVSNKIIDCKEVTGLSFDDFNKSLFELSSEEVKQLELYKLKEVYKRAGLKLSELANELKLSPNSISRVFAEKQHNMKVVQLARTKLIEFINSNS